MARFDTLAEIQRQCTLVADSINGRDIYLQKLAEATHTDGSLNITVRRDTDFVIFTNQSESYVVFATPSYTRLYKTINPINYAVQSEIETSNKGDRRSNEET